jgi:hypothetical protein
MTKKKPPPPASRPAHKPPTEPQRVSATIRAMDRARRKTRLAGK